MVTINDIWSVACTRAGNQLKSYSTKVGEAKRLVEIIGAPKTFIGQILTCESVDDLSSLVTHMDEPKATRKTAIEYNDQPKIRRPRRNWGGKTIVCHLVTNPRRKGTHGWRAWEWLLSKGGVVPYDDYKDSGHGDNHLKWDIDKGKLSII